MSPVSLPSFLPCAAGRDKKKRRNKPKRSEKKKAKEKKKKNRKKGRERDRRKHASLYRCRATHNHPAPPPPPPASSPRCYTYPLMNNNKKTENYGYMEERKIFPFPPWRFRAGFPRRICGVIPSNGQNTNQPTTSQTNPPPTKSTNLTATRLPLPNAAADNFMKKKKHATDPKKNPAV